MTNLPIELDSCVVLKGLTESELDAFFRLAKYEDFDAGAEILTEGQTYQGLWLLLNGSCEVCKKGNGSSANRLAVIEAGGIFGEMSFLEDAPHSASVVALSDAKTVRLMRDDFETLAESMPSAAHKLSINIIRVLSQRLRQMDDWTCELVEEDCDHKRHQEWKEFRARLYSDLEL